MNSDFTNQNVLTENIGRLLLLSFRYYERHLLSYLSEAGFGDIRMSHLPVLRSIELEGSRTTEIAERVNLTKQAVGVLIDELVSLTYVTRAQDPSDGRAKLARIAPRGRLFMAAFPIALKKADNMIAASIGESAFANLNDTLIQIVNTDSQSEI